MKVTLSLWVDLLAPLADGEDEDIAADVEAILVREIPAFGKVSVVDWTEGDR